MRKQGFLRKTVLLIAATWLFQEFAVRRSPYIVDQDARAFTSLALYGIAAFAFISFVAKRVTGGEDEK